MRIGFLLPYLSEIGPQNNCPIANPPRKVDRDICTLFISVFKSFAILGNAGKYMSIARGPSAVRLTSVKINIHS